MDLLISLLTINYFSHEIKIVIKNVIRCDLSVTCHVLQCDITLIVTCISVTCYSVTCISVTCYSVICYSVTCFSVSCYSVTCISVTRDMCSALCLLCVPVSAQPAPPTLPGLHL